MKILTWTIQTPRTSLTLVTSFISWVKETISKKNMVFLKIQLHIQLLSKVLPSTIFCMHHSFFNPTTGKPTAPAYQNTLTFDQYLYNSMSNMHVNLVYWNSLHPKMAILPTFWGKNPNFLSEKQKQDLTTYTIGKLGPLLSF